MSNIKKKLYQNIIVKKAGLPVYHTLKRSRSFSSKNYWESRYKKGGNSGAGSYGRLAKFKAQYLNDFAKKNKINNVLELGSGDGSQLKLFDFKNYIGFDVSKSSIDLCLKIYDKDKTKSFFLYDPEYFRDNHKIFKVDLSMSLDVIYHLVEDNVFEKYMKDMFAMSNKFVIIYASNTNDNKKVQAQHVRHRKFTDWVKMNQKNWKLVTSVENKFKVESNEIDESFADFYVYKKI